MKKSIFLFASSLLLLTNCNSNTDDPIILEGSTFIRSSFIIEIPVDANGDGVASTDLMQENYCFDLTLGFLEEMTTSIPTNDLIHLSVEGDGNGNLIQSLDCSHGDGPGMQYKMTDNLVEFYFSDNLNYTGVLSDDGNTITINVENRHLFPFNFFTPSDEILNPDGSITNYTGDAIIVYTRQ